MQIGTRVVAGADDVIDLLLNHVGFFSIEADSVATLKELSVMLDHGVGHARGLVIQGVLLNIVFDDVLRRGAIERAAHTRLAVSGSDVVMACGADRWIDVVRFGLLDWRRRRMTMP